MANFTYNPPSDFLAQLGRLADIEPVAKKMVDESIPIVKTRLIKELSYHENTGDLQASIQATRAKKTRNDGVYAAALPTGESETYVSKKGVKKVRKTPIRNMEKLAYLEYGTSDQGAKPVITRVLNDSEGSVEMKMEYVFKREMEK